MQIANDACCSGEFDRGNCIRLVAYSLMSFGHGSFVGTILPAWKALKQDVIQALAHE
jgi:hypothetical protein